VFSGDRQVFNVSEVAEQVSVLKKDVVQLAREEHQLDKDKLVVDQFIKQLTADIANEK